MTCFWNTWRVPKNPGILVPFLFTEWRCLAIGRHFLISITMKDAFQAIGVARDTDTSPENAVVIEANTFLTLWVVIRVDDFLAYTHMIKKIFYLLIIVNVLISMSTWVRKCCFGIDCKIHITSTMPFREHFQLLYYYMKF